MSNQKNLKLLIIETNNLTRLTTNSIEANMTGYDYKVVKPGDSKIGTALENTDDITLVIKSGLVLNIKEGDLPSRKRLSKYHLAVSREAVYADHPHLHNHYNLTARRLHRGMIDLSLFIINPAMWDEIPKSDTGLLSNSKLLFMPRYMNHRNDIVFEEQTINACDALTYGVLGEQACIHNYLGILDSKDISVLETYAYCLDKLLPFTEGLPREEKEIVECLGKKTKKRISRLRRRLHNVKFIN
jgi:hypothetical protein